MGALKNILFKSVSYSIILINVSNYNNIFFTLNHVVISHNLKKIFPLYIFNYVSNFKPEYNYTVLMSFYNITLCPNVCCCH